MVKMCYLLLILFHVCDGWVFKFQWFIIQAENEMLMVLPF